jgi:hypothetical protein
MNFEVPKLEVLNLTNTRVDDKALLWTFATDTGKLL